MNDAFLMSGFYTFSNLAADFQGFLNRQWSFSNTLLQGFTWDQFQHKKMNVICVLEAVDGCNVGVIELC